MITGDKEKHSAANLQYLIHTSHPLAAVGVQPLRQPCVQHPVITFAQGVDERSGVRTTVEHLATLGVQRIDFQMEHFLENADNIHNFQIPAFSPIACNMWQGTCTARIPGYGGQIDVNISYMG